MEKHSDLMGTHTHARTHSWIGQGNNFKCATHFTLNSQKHTHTRSNIHTYHSLRITLQHFTEVPSARTNDAIIDYHYYYYCYYYFDEKKSSNNILCSCREQQIRHLVSCRCTNIKLLYFFSLASFFDSIY